MATPLLEVDGLVTAFETDAGTALAADGVSFALEAGRTLGLVGESGCGKSVTALSILRLVPPPGRILAGAVRLRGRDLVPLPEEEIRQVRGAEIAMVFQEPMTSLHPLYTVGRQIAEAVREHRAVSRNEARERAIDLLRQVRISEPEKRVDEYPYQLSGGLRQRAMIAMALACDPSVLIADEPTTALDVTIQAQVLDLVRDLQAERGLAVLLITHDLGVVAEMADDVAVMYASRIVEAATVKTIFERPLHPYTRGLFDAVPRLDRNAKHTGVPIPGVVPDSRAFPSGCRFHPRCAEAKEQCAERIPRLRTVRESPQVHRVACDLVEDSGSVREPPSGEEDRP